MENMPVIYLTGTNIPLDIRDKVKMWSRGAYYPLYLKFPGLLMLKECQIVKPNPLYPRDVLIFYYESAQARARRDEDADRMATLKDSGQSFPTVERIWRAAYRLQRNFKNKSPADNKDDEAQENSILHLESFRFSPEGHEKCNEWFIKWAYRIYVPILVKLPGFIEYNRYRWMSEVKPIGEEFIGKTLETDYPPYLSIIEFENLQAWENYENSPELVAFKRAMESDLSITINYRWNVQYNLLKNWRK